MVGIILDQQKVICKSASGNASHSQELYNIRESEGCMDGCRLLHVQILLQFYTVKNLPLYLLQKRVLKSMQISYDIVCEKLASHRFLQ